MCEGVERGRRRRTNGFDEVLVLAVDVKRRDRGPRRVRRNESDIGKSAEEIASESGDVSHTRGGEEILARPTNYASVELSSTRQEDGTDVLAEGSLTAIASDLDALGVGLAVGHEVRVGCRELGSGSANGEKTISYSCSRGLDLCTDFRDSSRLSIGEMKSGFDERMAVIERMGS